MKKSAKKFLIWAETPGILPGMIAGVILGIQTQLYFLSEINWELPWLRLVGGGILGSFLGLGLTAGLGKVLIYLRMALKDQPFRFSGYGLLVSALINLFFWNALTTINSAWILFASWFLWTFFLVRLYVFFNGLLQEKKQKIILITLLTSIVIFGLFLRLGGLYHGLPDYIVHCDTPKQLRLIPAFIDGYLEPPDSYPVGHIFFYSNVLRFWRFITGITTYIPGLESQNIPNFLTYIISIRAFQAFISSMIPLLGFLITRNLWGPWVGLISAFLLACDPVQLTYSHQEMGEVPQAFWVMASLWFSSRFWVSKKIFNIFFAGLCAGMAISVKIYGGFIVIAAIVAILMSSGTSLKGFLFIILGIIIGIIVGTPYLLFNPESWWNNVFVETIRQWNIQRDQFIGKSRWEMAGQGLIFLWQGIVYRFYLPWIILSLLGLVFLFIRHRKEDQFFLVPAILSILIIVNRLYYLREWDFVNLTPFLSICAAVFVVFLWKFIYETLLYRRLALVLLAFFFIFQAWIPLSDVWINRQPDTRHLARRWVLRHLEIGSHLLYSVNLSSGFAMWLPQKEQVTLSEINENLLKTSTIPAALESNLAVVEKAWWEHPFPTHYEPVQIFRLRHNHWENPEIYAFYLNPARSHPEIIKPHIRIQPPEPTFMNTPWSRRQPMDLFSDSEEKQEKKIFSDQPLGPLNYAILGRGKASIFFGPTVGFPAEVKESTINTGVVSPLRHLLPMVPRAYKIAIAPKPGKQILWAGFYPRPEYMSPLLFRYKDWLSLEKIAQSRMKLKDCPAELYLFYATSLSVQGKIETAKRVLDNLHQDHPDFLKKYQNLSASKGDLFLKNLQTMSQATLSELYDEEVFWPNRSKDFEEIDRVEPGPSSISKANYFHLWMPHSYLPGFLKAKIQIKTSKTSEKTLFKMTVIGFQKDFFHKDLGIIKFKGGGNKSLELPFLIPVGPIRLEFRLESDDDQSRPEITSVLVRPDYEAEIKWRWKVFTDYLPLAD